MNFVSLDDYRRLTGRLYPEPLDEEISAGWLKGVSAGWKKVLVDIQAYEGRVPLKPDPSQAEVVDAMDAAVHALTLLKNYVRLLSHDLLIAKGLWDLPSELGAAEASRTKRWKTKVIEELHTAEQAVTKYLDLALSKQKALSHPVSTAKRGELLQRTHAYVDKATTQVNAAVGSVLKTLRATQKYYASKGRKLDPEGFEPAVNHVGPFTIVFKDTPDVSPMALGRESFKGKKRKRIIKATAGWRHPKHRAEFLRQFKDAWALLRAKRLDWLADIKVSVKARGGGGHSLGTLAYYYRQGDTMGVVDEPSPKLARSIVHELGHRYYFKHMTSEDRHNFDKWFGDVPAVTKYGGTDPAEDFAEVFAYYVLGRKLSKDQHDRFRQFMTGRRPRTESPD